MKRHQKKAGFKSILVAGATITLSLLNSVVYGQTTPRPPANDCIYPGFNNSQRAYYANPQLKQARLDQSNVAFNEKSYGRWLCGASATLYVSPESLAGIKSEWDAIMRDLGWPGPWSYPPEYTIKIDVVDETTGSRVTMGTYNMMTGSYSGATTRRTGREGWFGVEVISEGRVRNSAYTTKGISSNAQYFVQAGLSFGNIMSYSPRYIALPDPCRYEFNMSLNPSRINLGSQTTRNFTDDVRRTANFKVAATRNHYVGCNAPSTHPRVTLTPQGGSNIDGVMYLNNGTEIEVMDITAGQKVQFGVPVQMGKVLEAYKYGRVERDYRLTWRKTPGAQVEIDEFQKVIKIQVEFP